MTTSKKNSVIYTGVTSDLAKRIHQHKTKVFVGFSSKYSVDKLIYFEQFDTIDSAIYREKQIKGYSRKKKLDLIQSFNPTWEELYKNGVIMVPGSINRK